MRPWSVACLTLALVLAGCSGSPNDSGNAQSQPEPAFEVDATETTGVIRGVVVDEAIRPLGGVLVNLTTGQEAVTADDGAFGFQGLEPGTYFMQASKAGFVAAQSSADVVVGVDEPPIVKIQLTADPIQQPYIETYSFTGFLSFGASIGITSVGTTINPSLSETLNDQSIWNVQFTQVPFWAQGELVWDQSQAAGGMLIWEMVKGGSNNFRGYRETAESPALAFWNYTTLQAEAENVTDPDQGIDYRFFGGPHPALAPGAGIVPERESGHPVCTTFPTVVIGDRSLCSFGYGMTLNQRADAYVHQFYNFAPPPGWRYTVDGEPVVPDQPQPPPPA